MVDVNRTPYNSIPNKWAFDPDVEPFITDILNQLSQLRLRTGGDSDSFDNLQDDPYTKRQNIQLRAEIELLKDDLAQQKRLNRTLEQKINELEERYDSGT